MGILYNSPASVQYRDSTYDYYLHRQLTSNTRWEVNHNLGRIPKVICIVDGIVGEVSPKIVHINTSKYVLLFSVAYSGRTWAV